MSEARTSGTPDGSRSEGARPDERALADLRRKYERLVDLRRRRDRRAGAGPDAGRSDLGALAREFPGCLRELDACRLDQLEARLAAVDRAIAGGPCEPWVAWMDAYHCLFGAAMIVRTRLAKGRPHPAALVAEVLALASDRARLPLDEAFLDEVARPPGGRIGLVVLRRLAHRFSTPASAIAAALFPLRRPSPYSLRP